MKQTGSGFTLAELLIVVAIIAVLVAIAIPVFTAQLEISRESTDLANARSAYAELISAAILEDDMFRQADGTYQVQVSLRQKQTGWTINAGNLTVGGVSHEDTTHWIGEPGEGGTCTVKIAAGEEIATFIWSGGSGDGGDPNPGGSNAGGESTGGGNTGGGNAQNTATAQNIGNAIVNLLNQAGASNNTKVTITVHPDGNFDVETKGSATEEQIIAGLQNANLINEGTISFASDDEIYVNGYKVTVHKNNGHDGGKILIQKIN